MSLVPSSQVSLFAVGVENYQFMKRLRGPRKDIERFADLFTQSPATGLYSPSQIIMLPDPDSHFLRTSLNNFIINRSAEGDILIFYFSGHGIPIGRSDFGFCTTDSRIHDATGSTLPLTVLKLNDLIETLHVMNVIPVLIIDACYSGIAGKAIEVPPNDMSNIVKSSIASQFATNFAVFCACTDRQVTTGDINGGLFSKSLFDVMSEGLFTKKEKRKQFLSLQDLYDTIHSRIVSTPLNSTPQLFVGEALSRFPLVKNARYSPLEYQFTSYLNKILLALWNGGEERELEIGEILISVGRGAYGNHRKLSLGGWNLVDDNPVTKKRRLTEHGRQFIRGEITIPDVIVYDTDSGVFIPAPQSNPISFYMI
jgi:hypothetical protein